MITKAIIKEVTNGTSNLYKVYVPLLRSANDEEKDATYLATLCFTNGVIYSLKVGDVVFIEFEDNYYNKPVILGKLYTGKEDLKVVPTQIVVKSLKVLEKTELGKDTAIGNFDANDMNIALNNSLGTIDGVNTNVINLNESIKEVKENVDSVQANVKEINDNIVELEKRLDELGFKKGVASWVSPNTFNFEVNTLTKEGHRVLIHLKAPDNGVSVKDGKFRLLIEDQFLPKKDIETFANGGIARYVTGYTKEEYLVHIYAKPQLSEDRSYSYNIDLTPNEERLDVAIFKELKNIGWETA